MHDTKQYRKWIWLVGILAAALILGIAWGNGPDTDKPDIEGDKEMTKATFGAGCFWGVEAAFQKTKGVESTRVGFMGGTVDNPSYKRVCKGDTGHAEVVEVLYDPEKVTYEELLKVFWDKHNPTTKNRQGPDIGSQYRSVIFYHNEEQKEAAEKSKTELEALKKYPKPVVTEITEASDFWEAEEYHQQYLQKRGLVVCH